MVGDRAGIGTRAVGNGDAAGGGGNQVDLLVAGADHADDLQIGQGVDFGSRQAQRAAGEHGIDFAGVALDGLGAHLR
ncbi:hypothetical protein D3C76_1352910 [compost metagenome]